jgi:transposase-like protein
MRAGGNNVYSEDLKERAVKDYLEGKGSLRDITARYGIRDKISLRKKKKSSPEESMKTAHQHR